MTYDVDPNNLTLVQHEYNSDQQGEVRFVKATDGLEVHVKFVNNKIVDGDHYRCDVYLLDAAETFIAAAKVKAGVNARGTGGVEERLIDEKISLTPDELTRLSKITVDFGQFDGVDDTELWRRVGEAIAKYYFGDAVSPT